MKTKLKIAISILLGAFFLWIAVRNVSLNEIVNEIKTVKWIYLIPAFALALLSHVFRAFRWGVILKNIKKISFLQSFSINSVGFLFIHIIPLRLGEAAKPYLLKKNHGVRKSAGFATVAIERTFDGLALVFFLVLSFIFANFKTETLPYVGISINYLIISGVLIFSFALISLLMLVYREGLAIKILSKITSILPERYQQKILGMAKAFVYGLSSLPSIKHNALIIFHSLAIWLLTAGIMYLILIAFDLKLSWEASFIVLGIVSLGIMLPGPPGFVGNFQLFCQGALGLYGVSEATGLSYSIIVHALNIACVFLLGFIFLPSNFISYKDVMESKDNGDEETSDIAREKKQIESKI